MHQTSMEYGMLFYAVYGKPFYLKQYKSQVLEIGHGGITFFKDLFEPVFTYNGYEGLHSSSPGEFYQLPYPNESQDIVIASSVFEHDEMFWITFLEMLRVLKPHGLIYANTPSNGVYHPHPMDCWRFYPDSAEALVKWAKKHWYNPMVLEQFTNLTNPTDIWHDYVAVWLKDANYKDNYTQRILDVHTNVENARKY